MSKGEQDRLEELVHHLHYPTLEQRRALIQARLDSIPEEERKGPPPWPLSEEDLSRILASPRRTPRAVLQLCSATLRGQAPPDVSSSASASSGGTDLATQLDEAFRRYTDEARAHIDLAGTHGRGVDAPLLSDSMRTALGLVDGLSTHALKLPLASAVAFTVRRGEESVDVLLGQHSNGRSFSATVDLALKTLEAQRRLVLVREHDVAVPTSWDKSVKTLAKIQASWPGSFLELARRELTALLAAQRLLAAVQSQDLLDDAGSPIATDAARAWLRGKPDSPFAALAELLLSRPQAQIAAPIAPTQPPSPAPPPKPSPKPKGKAVPASEVAPDVLSDLLRELRVASVDGLARRLFDAGVEVPRAEVVRRLRARSDVRWFGETLVSFQEAR
jgi:hypothetical protein